MLCVIRVAGRMIALADGVITPPAGVIALGLALISLALALFSLALEPTFRMCLGDNGIGFAPVRNECRDGVKLGYSAWSKPKITKPCEFFRGHQRLMDSSSPARTRRRHGSALGTG